VEHVEQNGSCEEFLTVLTKLLSLDGSTTTVDDLTNKLKNPPKKVGNYKIISYLLTRTVYPTYDSPQMFYDSFMLSFWLLYPSGTAQALDVSMLWCSE